MTDFHWISSETFGATGFETEWLTIDKARRGGAGAPEALAKICQTYWYPLYVYVRGKGFDRHEAQDLTQEFFSSLLTKPWLENVHPSKGRFRAYLLAAMNNFLVDEWRRENTAKRGGGRDLFSLDAIAAEQRFNLEPAHHESPDRLFDHSWAVTVSRQALANLKTEYQAPDQAPLFDALQPMLTSGKKPERQTEIARRLDLNPGAVRKTAQRLRDRYLELLRAEIARTVLDPAELDEEIRHVLGLLSQ